MVDRKTGPEHALAAFLAPIPLAAWLSGCLGAVILEALVGEAFAVSLGLQKIPALFGCAIALKRPLQFPAVVLYLILIYLIPAVAIGRSIARPFNRLVGVLYRRPIGVSVIFHIALLYTVLHLWSDISPYRVLTLKLALIAVMLTLSLNVINGYMGEFSCSHPGFMALGAYAASVLTISLFVNDRSFGPAILPTELGPVLFPIALVCGGVFAAAGALIVAVPSFRTRGDYLAIVSLAFLFIVKSIIENIEWVGGSRGLRSQPDLANLPTVFTWTVLCIWTIHNFVGSIPGKALNAVRDDEIAADAMTVNTRKTKMTGFMFSAFWAGIAGGLFAHVLRYVNPSTFGIQKLAEVLAMVYFGGLNSVYGSIVGAVSLSLLGEALRPLEIYKWIIIPLMLILVMIFRPTGLIAFRAFNIRKLIRPRE